MGASALAGWKLGGDVRLRRTAFGTLDTPLDRAGASLAGPRSRRLEARPDRGATRTATGDAALATQTLSFTSSVGRDFAGGRRGESHRLGLRLEEESARDQRPGAQTSARRRPIGLCLSTAPADRRRRRALAPRRRRRTDEHGAQRDQVPASVLDPIVHDRLARRPWTSALSRRLRMRRFSLCHHNAPHPGDLCADRCL